jgi:hypothetical protein
MTSAIEILSVMVIEKTSVVAGIPTSVNRVAMVVDFFPHLGEILL